MCSSTAGSVGSDVAPELPMDSSSSPQHCEDRNDGVRAGPQLARAWPQERLIGQRTDSLGQSCQRVFEDTNEDLEKLICAIGWSAPCGCLRLPCHLKLLRLWRGSFPLLNPFLYVLLLLVGTAFPSGCTVGPSLSWSWRGRDRGPGPAELCRGGGGCPLGGRVAGFLTQATCFRPRLPHHLRH